MNKKQKTLFETWNQCSAKSNSVSQGPSKKNETSIFPGTSAYNSPSHNVFQPTLFSRIETELVDGGFDHEAGQTWIYPTNYPVRDYQFAIVKEALFKNTLVILPTGLGKTFIAAVVMYNIYRWYPKGKVVFMAPTRPLVAQQIDACYKVTGISQADTTQMTGTNMPEERKRMWMKKRVFFLTPQVLVNDIVRNICPAASIKCIVVDEAHKALGNHAYSQVIRELQAYTTNFRVLALTATPGSDTQAVKLVLSNLLISHVEMRTEDSDDVKEFTHIRDIEKIVVPLGDRLLSIKSRFLDVINIYLKRLTQRRAMTSKNPASLTKFQILKMREDFSQHPPDKIDKFSYGLAMADFSLCISLYHAYELLLLHGARPFYNFLTGIVNGEKSIPHARSELLKNLDFEELLGEVQENYITESIQSDPNAQMGANGHRVLPGHPKLEKLLEVVLEHFRKVNGDSMTSTRVMIFSQYRDSVQEIAEMLNHHQPMIKVMSFIGQSSKSATNAGYSQKHQLKVIQQFRSGGYNTLVSTCVGEEGLDIGEVDLIVCYDCPKSPIRLVQRMGRTGRLRRGRIIILIAEGKEEQMYNSCESKKKSVHRAISKGFAFTQLYHNSPSLIPPGIKPTCVKTVVTVEPPKSIVKSKGKCQDTGFLTNEELVEFNNCFKVPKCQNPLLPSSSFVSLKTEEQVQDEQTNLALESSRDMQLSEPSLSLSKWLLWQTTPQRTHMVSHSSKSLLLIETVEKINFPNMKNLFRSGERLPKISCPSNINATSTHNLIPFTTSNLIPPTIDLDQDDDFAGFDDLPNVQNETMSAVTEDLDTHTVQMSDIVSTGNRIGLTFLPFDVSLNPVPSETGIEKGNLLKRLFGITSMKLPCKPTNCILEPPPLIGDSLSIEDFTSHLIKSRKQIEHKSYTTLHILNKKMKARLKRKTRELGINVSFSFINGNLETSMKENVTLNSTMISQLKTKDKCLSFDASFDSFLPDRCTNSDFANLNQAVLPKSITFDIAFDIPQVFDEFKDKSNNKFHCSPDKSKQNLDVPVNNEKPDLDLDNFDGDSSLIFEQFFSNKDDDIAEKLEASFTLPLTIKKVLFESNSPASQQVQSERSKFETKVTSNLNNFSTKDVLASPNSYPHINPVDKIDSSRFSASNKNLDPTNISGIKRNPEDSKINTGEPTQYTLTQLVSLLDNTINVENVKEEKSKILENDKTVPEEFDDYSSFESHSSDEEIEPTPPRKKIPTASKFCYRSNSLNLDSDSWQKGYSRGDEMEKPSSPVNYAQSISFDLLDTHFPLDKKAERNKAFRTGPKNTVRIKDGIEEELKYASESKTADIAVDSDPTISFDLSDVPLSSYHKSEGKNVICMGPKNIVEFKGSIKDIHGDSLKIKSDIALKSDPSISFDLSDIQFSPCDRVVVDKPKSPSRILNSIENKGKNASKQKGDVCAANSNENTSFDLSDVQFSLFNNAQKNGLVTYMRPKSPARNKESIETTRRNGSKRKINNNPENFSPSASFNLSDVLFSPYDEAGKNFVTQMEEKKPCGKKYDKNMEHNKKDDLNLKISSSPHKFNTSISFDLSDVQFSPCNREDANVAAFHMNRKSPFRFKSCTKVTDESVLKHGDSDSTVNCGESVSFDEKGVTYPPSDRDEINVDMAHTGNKFPSKMKDSILDVDQNTLFESPTLDKIFFDISFDFPDLKPAPSNGADNLKEMGNSVTEIVPLKDKEKMNIPFDQTPTETDYFSLAQNSLQMKTNVQKDSVISLSHIKELTLHQKSINDSKLSFSNFKANELPNSEGDFMPAKSNHNFNNNSLLGINKRLDNRKQASNENINLSLLQKSPESSETLFEQIKRRRHNVLNDTEINYPFPNRNECDDFKQPLSTNKPRTINRIRSKECKLKNKNKFLLTQVAVSGSESSDDEIIECGEDEDALEASFINDNTLVESPINQRAMYLQSVKNFVGLPQKFKLKRKDNYADSTFSQPPDEGCSKYLLDSFCVDDDEVVYTSSDPEIEENVKNIKTKAIKKRKRIVILSNTSSSDEEVLVKKIKPTDEKIFIQKITPQSNSSCNQECTKISGKRKPNLVLISSDDGEFSPIRPVCEKWLKRDTVSERKPVPELSKPSTSNTTHRNINSNSELPKQLSKNLYNTDVFHSKRTSVSEPFKSSNSSSTHSNSGLIRQSSVNLANTAPPQSEIRNVLESSKPSFSGLKPNTSREPTSSNYETLRPSENLHNIDLNCANFSFDIGWDDPPVNNPQRVETENADSSTTFVSNLQNTRAEKSPFPRNPQLQSTGSEETPASNSSHLAHTTNPMQYVNSFSVCVPPTKNCTITKTILVDSRELASGKPVISMLRNKFGVNPVVMQLTAADYIISNKVAVERILDSDFPNSGLPIKLVEKVRAMNEVYEKSFVIIEKDNRKRPMGFNKLSTKYLQFAVFANVHPTLKVLYSNSVDDTASLIYDLIEKERKKGFHIDVPVVLKPNSQKLFDFYHSLPHVSPICAFNFVYHFPSVRMFLNSSAEQLKKAGFISTRKALDLLQHLSSELLFDPFS